MNDQHHCDFECSLRHAPQKPDQPKRDSLRDAIATEMSWTRRRLPGEEKKLDDIMALFMQELDDLLAAREQYTAGVGSLKTVEAVPVSVIDAKIASLKGDK